MNRYFANAMTDQELISLFQNFQAGALKVGYTSVQDYAIGLQHGRNLDLLNQANVSIRWRAICFPLSLDEACDSRPQFSPYLPFNFVHGSGIKWITDGSPIERFAHVSVAYLDRPGWFGHADVDAPGFETVFTRALSGPPARNQTHLHIAGDVNWDTVFATMTSLAPDSVWRQQRTRVEHGDLFRPDQYALAKQKGIMVVGNPLHFSIADLLKVRFQPSVVANIMPWKTLVQNNIPIGIGTDSITIAGNPFLDMFFSLTHPAHPSEALDLETTVIAYTMGSAYAEFQEQFKGSLKPGKLADLAVLSQDIFTIPVPSLPATESVLTIVDGKIAYDNRP
jgi:predicted amidohydrolase YtcJ